MASRYPAKDNYQDDEVAEEYDRIRFSSRRGKRFDMKEKRILERYMKRLDSTESVLDLACGTGRISEWLAVNGYNVTGLDISPQMIAKARERLADRSNARFEMGDAENLRFPDDFFDVAVSFKLMGHLPADVRRKVLGELARVSRSGVIVSVPIYNIYYRLHVLVSEGLRGKRLNWNATTIGRFRKELEQAGLALVKGSRVKWPFSATVVVLAMKNRERL